jgi:hypothetical protein
MTIPLWVLLGFAAWTLLTLFTTVGVYRWTRILTGRSLGCVRCLLMALNGRASSAA